jgi:C_GCAxxG_C_C family probable redox protein
MTVTRADDAEAIFRSGFSCSQAVSLAFAEDYHIDRENCLKLSCAFGGGMAHSGCTCGAVTGALMVIGMKHGRTGVNDLPAKDKTYAVTKKFMTEFLRRNHSLNCTELVGYDLSDPAKLAVAREKGLFRTRCVTLVRDAADILEIVL